MSAANSSPWPISGLGDALARPLVSLLPKPYHLISTRYLESLRTASPPLPPIDNSSLLASTDSPLPEGIPHSHFYPPLRPNLEEHRDFVLLDREGWDLLVEATGGSSKLDPSHTIIRRVVQTGSFASLIKLEVYPTTRVLGFRGDELEGGANEASRVEFRASIVSTLGDIKRELCKLFSISESDAAMYKLEQGAIQKFMSFRESQSLEDELPHLVRDHSFGPLIQVLVEVKGEGNKENASTMTLAANSTLGLRPRTTTLAMPSPGAKLGAEMEGGGDAKRLRGGSGGIGRAPSGDDDGGEKDEQMGRAAAELAFDMPYHAPGGLTPSPRLQQPSSPASPTRRVARNATPLLLGPPSADDAIGSKKLTTYFQSHTNPSFQRPSFKSSAPRSYGYGLGSSNSVMSEMMERSGVQHGLAGLSNLGNTCFMNSSLQCLLHTEPLCRYFLTGEYETDINEDNPLGMKGELCRSFADLMSKVWHGNVSHVTPRRFKTRLGEFAPQFSGYRQQDSQELTAFLLDGLHEDLNRVKNKPYMEEKDDQGRPDAVLAAEAWQNYKARNDSYLVDHFQGMYKSQLWCPRCKHTAIKFDPFLYLSLPLPDSEARVIQVIYIDLEGKCDPTELAVRCSAHGTIEELVLAMRATLLSSGAGGKAVPASPLHGPTAFQGPMSPPSKSPLAAAHAPFPPPSPIAAPRSPAAAPPCSPGVSTIPADEVYSVVDIMNRKVTRFYKYEDSVSDINKHDSIYIYRQVVQEGVKLSPHRVAVLYFAALLKTKDPRYSTQYGLMTDQLGYSLPPLVLQLPEEDGADLVEQGGLYDSLHRQANASMARVDAFVKSQFDSLLVAIAGGNKQQHVNQDKSNDDKEEKEEDKAPAPPFPSPSLAPLAQSQEPLNLFPKAASPSPHARQSPIFQLFEQFIKSDAAELPVALFRTNDCGYNVHVIPALGNYDDYSDGCRRDSFSPRLYKSRAPSYSYYSTFDTKDEPEKHYYSFTFLTTSVTANLHLEKMAASDGMPPILYPTREDVHRALDATFKPYQHPSLRVLTMRDTSCSLAACLEQFTRRERLGINDQWRCSKCKEFVQAYKKLDLWTLPEILVVHLKRFSYTSTSRDKLDTLVDFPVEGLDLGAWLLTQPGGGVVEGVDPSVSSSMASSSPPLYDLYAVSNHFGGLGGGHYTAYAKLFTDNQWYEFDDSRTMPVDPERVVSSGAYLLFYRRRAETERDAKKPFNLESMKKPVPEVKEDEAEEEPVARPLVLRPLSSGRVRNSFGSMMQDDALQDSIDLNLGGNMGNKGNREGRQRRQVQSDDEDDRDRDNSMDVEGYPSGNVSPGGSFGAGALGGINMDEFDTNKMDEDRLVASDEDVYEKMI